METDHLQPAAATSLGGRLRTVLASQAAAATGLEVTAADVELSAPRQAGHGDLATNLAMTLAKRAGRPPREIAQEIADGVSDELGDRLASVEVAGPGFLNLSLGASLVHEALAPVASAGSTWGGGTAATRERLNVEFVSANPTGPMHIGHARNAAYGDALARILAFHGHEIAREYYVNDFGSQVRNLGLSIQARARGEEVPEDGYQGDYVVELAQSIPGAAEADISELSRAGVAAMLERARQTLDGFGVSFDRYFSERALHEGEPSALDRVLGLLRDRGELEQEDGAWWLRTERRGDDKDRVVIRANGEPTYYASDLAYMRDKLERGYDRQLLVLGADHHGYIGRMRAAFEAFGGDPERLELLIMQLVTLIEGGEPVKMSKRAGQFVTLEDLVREIGTDAARWFLLQRSHETAIDLDLDLARKESSENPVYYVQYAHARCCSVLERVGGKAARFAAGEGQRADAWSGALAGLDTPVDPAETTLVLALGRFEEAVAQAAARRAPHRIATYALELAQTFTAFYRDCQIAGVEPQATEQWRAALTRSTRDVLASALGLLGVAAPQRMERREDDAE